MAKEFQGQGSDEKVLAKIRIYLPRYLLEESLNILTILGLGMVFGFFSFILYQNYTIPVLISLIFIAVGLSVYIGIFWYNTFLIVTNKRILKFEREGIFKENIREMEIYILQECICKIEGFIDKILKCGSVNFIGRSEKTVIYFPGTPYPDEVIMYVSRVRDYIIDNPESTGEEIATFMPRHIRKKQKVELDKQKVEQDSKNKSNTKKFDRRSMLWKVTQKLKKK